MKKSIVSIAFIALAIGVSLSSCSKKTDTGGGTDTGKVDPNTIAPANLVAYFPLESATNAIAFGQGITFDQQGGAATFVTGRRGNAYQGSSDGAYLTFDLASNNPFVNMKAFTISAWIKTPPAIVNGANGAAIIAQVDGGDVATMGSLAFVLQSNSSADSLDISGYLYNSSTAWQGQEVRIWNAAFLPNQWVHLIYSYDNVTSTMSLYANGMLVGSQIKYAGPDPGDGTPQPLLGDLTLVNMTKMYIGAWFEQVAGVNAQDWMRYFPGMIDELRVYNRALTAQEVTDLYAAEASQIN